MRIVTETHALKALAAELERGPYVAIDTEFMRDQTYWPKLCLIQAAGPGVEAIIDPLADGIDLTPFHHLLADKSVMKVFHAARQDVEIFHHPGRDTGVKGWWSANQWSGSVEAADEATREGGRRQQRQGQVARRLDALAEHAQLPRSRSGRAPSTRAERTRRPIELPRGGPEADDHPDGANDHDRHKGLEHVTEDVAGQEGRPRNGLCLGSGTQSIRASNS